MKLYLLLLICEQSSPSFCRCVTEKSMYIEQKLFKRNDYGSLERLNIYKEGCISTLCICFGNHFC